MPTKLTVTRDELARVASLLIEYGGGALAWRRISETRDLRDTPEAADFLQINRHFALEAMMKERGIAFIAGLLNEVGIEPLIFKGWAVARHYPSAHLRPFGDVDICAPPGRYDEVQNILRRHAIPGMANPRHGIASELGFTLHCGSTGKLCQVDLHPNLDKFRLAPLSALYARSHTLTLEGNGVRTLSHEDHLRLVAIHFLRHGGVRPLWLCDVAVLLEGVPKDFDWKMCFGEDDPRVTDWIAWAFQLAHQLLGARIEHVPLRYRVDRLPAWFVGTVVEEWAVPFCIRHLPPTSRLTWIIRAALKQRWPNPIRTTVASNCNFDRKIRLRYQLASIGGLIADRLRTHVTANHDSQP